jgi:uncharacterized protein YbcI
VGRIRAGRSSVEGNLDGQLERSGRSAAAVAAYPSGGSALPWVVHNVAAWFSFSSFRAATTQRTREQDDMDAEASREQPGTEEERTGLMMVELSNAMVQLYKELFGRGPTKTRTSYAGPDLLVTTLENSLTRIERTMAENGEHERLRDLRMHFQYMSEDDFVGIVEQITGRKVRAFVSGVDTKRDVSSELFYLEPQSGPAAI